MITTPSYSQLDPRWASKPLGSTTIGKDGCAMTSLAAMLANFAITITPDELVYKLAQVGGVQSDGGVLWTTLSRVFPRVAFVKRAYTTNTKQQNIQKELADAALGTIRHNIMCGQPVPVNVDHVYGDRVADHWVLAMDVMDDDFLIMNPVGGVFESFKKRYGDPRENIYGYALFSGPPINFPNTACLAEKKLGLAIGLSVDDRYRKDDIHKVITSA